MFVSVLLFSPKGATVNSQGRKPLESKTISKIPLQPRRGDRGVAETVAPSGLGESLLQRL